MVKEKKKLIRLTTHAMSLKLLLDGQLKYLNNYFEVIGVSSPHEDLDFVAKREEVRTCQIYMEREIALMQDIKSLFIMIKFFLKERPDIIHSNTPKSSLLSMIAGFITGIRIRIYTVTGLRFEGESGLKRTILILIEKITCFFATHIIAEGQGVNKIMTQYNLTFKRASVINKGSINGVDINRFSRENLLAHKIIEIKKQINYQNDCFYFLFVGRLVNDKGIHELVEAFTRLSNYRSNVRLILVGDFDGRQVKLKPETVNQINNNRNIISIGFSIDVEYYMSIANCFVFPSYREGFPNVLLQSGAMGCPIICSNIPANFDIISQPDKNTVFEPRNSESLYNSMLYAVDQEDMIKKGSNNLRIEIVDNFSRPNVQQNLVSFYKSIL